MDPTQVSAGALAALATGGGAPFWALAIAYIIESLKYFGVPGVNGREKLAAFIIAGLLVVAAFITALQVVPPTTTLDFVGVILAIMAWFTVGRLAMASHDDKERKPGSLLEPSAEELRRTDPVVTIPNTPPAPPAIGADPDAPVPGAADDRIPGDSP